MPSYTSLYAIVLLAFMNSSLDTYTLGLSRGILKEGRWSTKPRKTKLQFLSEILPNKL